MSYTVYNALSYHLYLHFVGSGSHKLMASYVNFKRTRNYLRLCGLRKHLRLKPDQKRHNCEVCKKVFKNEKLMSFHECKLIRKYLNKYTDDKRFMKYNSDSKIKHFENKEPNKFRKEGELTIRTFRNVFLCLFA